MPRFGRAFPSRRTLWRPFGAAVVTATISGTATVGILESDVVTGGKTIIISLVNDTWVAAGGTFDAQRQNIINGIDSAQAEALGWDAKVKALEVVTAVVRTSATIVTVTLSASATYNITATETITVTVPSTALVGGGAAVVGAPTFTVAAVGAAVFAFRKTFSGIGTRTGSRQLVGV